MDLNADIEMEELVDAGYEAVVDAGFDVGDYYREADAKAFIRTALSAAFVKIESRAARATADAIADQIDAARNPKPVGTGVHADGAFKRAARIARSFGSTAPEGPKS